MDEIADNDNDITEVSLDGDAEEIVYVIAGLVAKKLSTEMNCEECWSEFISSGHGKDDDYFSLLHVMNF